MIQLQGNQSISSGLARIAPTARSAGIATGQPLFVARKAALHVAPFHPGTALPSFTARTGSTADCGVGNARQNGRGLEGTQRPVDELQCTSIATSAAGTARATLAAAPTPAFIDIAAHLTGPAAATSAAGAAFGKDPQRSDRSDAPVERECHSRLAIAASRPRAPGAAVLAIGCLGGHYRRARRAALPHCPAGVYQDVAPHIHVGDFADPAIHPGCKTNLAVIFQHQTVEHELPLRRCYRPHLTFGDDFFQRPRRLPANDQ